MKLSQDWKKLNVFLAHMCTSVVMAANCAWNTLPWTHDYLSMHGLKILSTVLAATAFVGYLVEPKHVDVDRDQNVSP